SSDFAGIKPITKSEGARLLLEAESNSKSKALLSFEDDLLNQLRTYLKRELSLADKPAEAPLFENNEGIRYNEGSSLDARLTGEASFGQHISLLVEPEFLSTAGLLRGRL